MRRYFYLFLMVILQVVALSPNTPSYAQESSATRMPYFGTGMAVIMRPEDDIDYYTKMALTPDNNYVLGMSGATGNTLYLWDISALTDTTIQPEPQQLDLSDYRSSGKLPHINLMVLGENAIVQIDTYLLEIAIPSLDILNTAHRDASEGRFGRMLKHETTVLVIDDVLKQAFGWNTTTNEQFSHDFAENIVEGERWANGWYLTSYQDNDSRTIVQFCDELLAQCMTEHLDGSVAMILNDIIVVGDTDEYNAESLYPTRYYTLPSLAEGLVETESPFPFLPSDGYIPMSISPDGDYLQVLTPNPGAQPNGFAPLRTQKVWSINAEQEGADIGWGKAFWFDEHHYAQDLNLYSATSRVRLDEIPIAQVQGYYFHHEVNDIVEFSPDGSLMLYNTGGAAVVFPIDYQLTDDLMTIGTTQWQLTRDGLSNINLTPNGEYVIARDGDILRSWHLADNTQQELDISAYLDPEANPKSIEVIIRNEDVFLKAGHSLVRIQLVDLTILDVFTAESSAQYYEPFNWLLPSGAGLVSNGNYMAVVFAETVLIWHDDNTITHHDLSAKIIVPRSDGWWIYTKSYPDDPTIQDFYTCDFELADCHGFDFAEPIAVFREDTQFVSGLRFIDLLGETYVSAYWSINPEQSTIEEIDSFIDFPAPTEFVEETTFTPVGFYDDYMLVATFNRYDNQPRHIQIWSLETGELVNSRGFTGDWVGVGDYLLFTRQNMLTILHLTDERYTRWQTENLILDIQLSADEQSLLIIDEEMVSLVSLRE